MKIRNKNKIYQIYLMERRKIMIVVLSFRFNASNILLHFFIQMFLLPIVTIIIIIWRRKLSSASSYQQFLL